MFKIILWRFKLIIFLAIIFSGCKSKQKIVSKPSISTQQYIQKFEDISRTEMKRKGIPASITLAQGILESGSGSSTLAREANNHFGIKCGSNWNGPSMKRKDDDYKRGRLVKSCFRKYDNPNSSYRDHSEFLSDPKKAYRYGFLFELSSTDYKGWAKGLQKAGYATSRTYASKLIRIIEQYQLYNYDLGIIPDPDVKQNIEGIYHIVIKGDTLYSIAKKFNTTVSVIKKLNNLQSDQLQIGQQLLIR